jgi:hypothetical protein
VVRGGGEHSARIHPPSSFRVPRAHARRRVRSRQLSLFHPGLDGDIWPKTRPVSTPDTPCALYCSMLSLQCHESGSAAKLGSRTKSVRRVVRSDARRAPVPRPPRASNKRRWGFHALHDSRRHNSAMLGPSHPDTNARSPLRVPAYVQASPFRGRGAGAKRGAANMCTWAASPRPRRRRYASRECILSILSYLVSLIL